MYNEVIIYVRYRESDREVAGDESALLQCSSKQKWPVDDKFLIDSFTHGHLYPFRNLCS